jgi:hypothetical protein
LIETNEDPKSTLTSSFSLLHLDPEHRKPSANL